MMRRLRRSLPLGPLKQYEREQAGIISGTLNKFGTTGLRVGKLERKPLIGHEVTRWAGRKLRHPALSSLRVELAARR